MNNETIPQVQKLKYLGIIIDYKLTFRYHINYTAEKCTKLIFVLAKSAKINWELGHKALKTIYVGGILPLPLYGAPVWIRAMEKEKYKNKITRVQRLININPSAWSDGHCPHTVNITCRGVTGTARMLHALTHSSISRQVREQM